MLQIWQSFFRGDKSHKRESSRFGLGLSIVTAIMKLHGKNAEYTTPTAAYASGLRQMKQFRMGLTVRITTAPPDRTA